MAKALMLDYDGTLASFKQSAGTSRVKDMLAGELGAKSEEIAGEFGQIYNELEAVLHSRANPASVEIIRKINAYQILESFDAGNYENDFRWSRELWLRYLSDKYELGLEGDRIMKIIDGYWQAIAESSPLFPDVAGFLEVHKDLGIYIITASDKRVIINQDNIRYDAPYSEKLKVSRLKATGLCKYINESNIITGDPFDKPSEQFWDRAVAKSGIVKRDDVIVVDDALSTVKMAKKMGFKGYVMDRYELYDKKETSGDVDGYITGLDQLIIDK